MKRLFSFIVLLLLLASCANKSNTFSPSKPLTETEMIDLLTDIQIIEADLTRRKSNGTNTAYLAEAYYEQLFEHHGITDSIFAENMRYYTERPAVLERIMDSVVARLTSAAP
ncbi:MAG: DUF4296 domain-containing protein [Bacteroidales bacterium]|nr:DUF4296 domain-containing protein [Bacteroidales bacterium]